MGVIGLGLIALDWVALSRFRVGGVGLHRVVWAALARFEAVCVGLDCVGSLFAGFSWVGWSPLGRIALLGSSWAVLAWVRLPCLGLRWFGLGCLVFVRDAWRCLGLH